MATGKSGYFEYSNTPYMTAQIEWSEEYDAVANTSRVSITALKIKSSTYRGNWYPNGWIKVNGQTVITFGGNPASHYVGIPSADGIYRPVMAQMDGSLNAPWWSGSIPHNTDGSQSITIESDLSMYRPKSGSSSSKTLVLGYHAQTIDLTHIPRASTIGATDANIGAVSMLAINRKSSNYTHTISYAFGGLSGFITSDGGISGSPEYLSATSIAFAVPTAFYGQIPNDKSGTCTLTITTYSGSTQIGDSQSTSFKATAAEADCSPVVSGSVIDANEVTKHLTGDAHTLVRFFSDALCTISATVRNAASIANKTIGGQTVRENTRTIQAVESSSVVFAAQDSRGYGNSTTVTKAMIPYIKLTNNAVAGRNDPTSGKATLSLSGDCFVGSFGAVTNMVQAKYRIENGAYVDVPLTIADNNYTAAVPLSGLDYQHRWNIEIVVSDALMTVTKTVTIMQGIPVFDWGEHDINFNVPIKIRGKTMLDYFHPVGSIYISNDSTSPAQLFGGDWLQIKDTFILAAGDKYKAGTTGGSDTISIELANLPRDSMTFENLNSGDWSTGQWDSYGGNAYGARPNYLNTVGRPTGVPINNMGPFIAKYMWERVG